MTIDPISDERLAEIRAGLEGVTPGPWRVCETHDGEIIGRPSWPCRRHGVNGEWRVAIADELDGATFEQDANATHIARLDPQTVAALLSRLDKAEAGWQDISTAPKTGERLLLWEPSDYRTEGGEAVFGSWRTDSGFSGNEQPLWLDESYDDFSCGYASRPLNPTHWRADIGAPLPPPPSES